MLSELAICHQCGLTVAVGRWVAQWGKLAGSALICLNKCIQHWLASIGSWELWSGGGNLFSVQQVTVSVSASN